MMGYEIDFLPVGDGEKSGDAITLRFGNLFGQRHEQTVVVVDGGFLASGEKVVSHVRKHYQTDSVDIVVSTHPDSDHCSGLRVVLEELEVKQLWMHQPWNHTDEIADLFKDGRVTDNSVSEALQKSLNTARELDELAQSKGIAIVEPFAGVHDATKSLIVVGPTEEYYESLLVDFRGTPEPKLSIARELFDKAADLVKSVAETLEIETLNDDGVTPAENNSSAILLLRVDADNCLLTGDAGIDALTRAADSMGYDNSNGGNELTFMQVPHHGSRRNVGPSILNRLVGPRLRDDIKKVTAFVSASKEGNPKHPAKKVANAFRRRGAPVHATQGSTKWHHRESPKRDTFSTSTPLPFFYEVDD